MGRSRAREEGPSRRPEARGNFRRKGGRPHTPLIGSQRPTSPRGTQPPRIRTCGDHVNTARIKRAKERGRQCRQLTSPQSERADDPPQVASRERNGDRAGTAGALIRCHRTRKRPPKESSLPLRLSLGPPHAPRFSTPSAGLGACGSPLGHWAAASG